MKWGGMTEDQALAMITINAAKSLGVEDRIGSIEVGKDADLVVYNKHPLSVYAVPQKTLVDGVVYFDREKDLELRKQIADEKKALLEKMKKDEEKDKKKPKGKPTPGTEEVGR
jgi:cytosine/adenosine deaminase-related metal-dependent hydrolase